VQDFFTELREFMLLTLIYIRGGIKTSVFLFHFNGGPDSITYPLEDDNFDIKATEMRVDIVRLTIALAVSFKLHTRIALDGYCFGGISKETKFHVDWDRLRLRQLLTLQEFELVDECVGILNSGEPKGDVKDHLARLFANHTDPPDDWPEDFEVENKCIVRAPVAVVELLRVCLFRNMNGADNGQPWGVRDRFVGGLCGLLHQMLNAHEVVHQIITTPLPLPYASLCKTLLTIFLVSMPFFVDYRLGWFANTMLPAIISLALLGIDAIATELENPFGDDSNDLDIVGMITELEYEAMECLRLTGDADCLDCFCWRNMPTMISHTSCRRLFKQLACVEHAAPEVINTSPATQDELFHVKYQRQGTPSEWPRQSSKRASSKQRVTISP